MIEDKLAARGRAYQAAVERNVSSQMNTHFKLGDELNSFLSECKALVKDKEVQVILQNIQPLEFSRPLRGDAGVYTVDSLNAKVLCDTLVHLLEGAGSISDSENTHLLGISEKSIETTPKGGSVFIVHGHDSRSRLELKELLEKRFHLKPVILSDQAEKGRTIIEKFEEEAKKCCYAFAILTPDDGIIGGTGLIRQARPNVVFELGWFYGRLGRRNVSILFKKGTQIHSDLDGIVRLEFNESVYREGNRLTVAAP